MTDKYQLMPDLTIEEYRDLKADIRIRGVLVPLERDEDGNILDGHHRRRIVEELNAEGIEVDCQSIIRPGLSEEAKRSHVRAINLLRRHLSPAQRRDLIAQQLIDTPATSDRLVAAALGVYRETVAKVRKELNSTSGLPLVEKRMGADGKARRKPGSACVVAKNEKETQRALDALDGLNADVLPNHPVHVRLLERIRRESDSAGRAIGVEDAPSVVGNADIRLGDFREVLNDIAEGTADLILTDPAYGKESLPLWGDLASLAARILRPGGLLVTYSGQTHLPMVLSSLGQSLEYVWIIAQVGHARKSHDYNRHVYANWKPILVFSKSPFTPGKWFDDILRGNGPEKDAHDWQQGEGEARSLVETFSRPGDLVLDPCCGSGTTAAASVALGRRFAGCDISGTSVANSRERVRLVLESLPLIPRS